MPTDGRAMPRGGGRQGVGDLPGRMEGMTLGQRGRRRGDAIDEYKVVRTREADRDGELRYGVCA